MAATERPPAAVGEGTADDAATPSPGGGARARWAGHRHQAVYAGLLLVFLVTALATPAHAGNYGAWSLLPSVTMFLFVLATRRVLEGFLWGSVLAVFMKAKADTLTAYNDIVFEQLTNADNLYLMLVLLSIGGLVSVLETGRLSEQFGRWAARLARTGRSGLVVTYFSTFALSNDPYLGTSTVAASLTPVNDRYGTPRELTAFTVRSSAVPVSTFNPLATGSVFVAGLLVANEYTDKSHEVSAYAHLLPYMYYCMAILVVTFLVTLGVMPRIGPMRRARPALIGAGPDDRDGDGTAGQEGTATDRRPPNVLNFFLAIALLIAATLHFGSMQLGLVVTLAVMALVLVAQGVFTAAGYLDAVLAGMKDMLMLVAIMAAAFVLVDGVTALGFTTWMIGVTESVVTPALLPFTVFVLFGITEFLVTLNWSLYIMALPVVIPLARSVGANTDMTIAALVSAGLWGATTCLTSDVGMLTAFSTRVDVFRHYITNLPYQLIAFVVAAAAYLVTGLVL